VVSIVTGGAGFIGANLVGRLLREGRAVVVIDNLARGRRAAVAGFLENPAFRFLEADLAIREACTRAFDAAAVLGQVDEVWHLAANSDIPAGVADADVDLKDTFLTTFEVLRQLKRLGTPTLYFASSSAVYGDLGEVELHEDIGPLQPISSYGAMKLASEAAITAACEASLDTAFLFRFPNVVGIPATHGVILDFVHRLEARRDRLAVLGDGTQQKAYLHVTDLLEAMLAVRSAAPRKGPRAYNIGPVDQGVTVRWIAEQVVARVSPGAAITYGTGNKGWVGDVPRFRYSTRKVQSLGWSPALGSHAAVSKAIDEIARQEGL
jgi:UDP-glucose 4-epimerase